MQRLEETTSQITIQSDPLRSSSSSLWSEPSGTSLRHSISKRPDTAFEGAPAVSGDPSAICVPDDCGNVSISRPGSSAVQHNDQHTSKSSSQQRLQTVDSSVSKSAVCKTALLREHSVRPQPPGRIGGRSQPSPKTRQLSQTAFS